jgi:glutamate formiminotransferase
LKKVTKSKLEFAKTKVSYHESNETYEKIDEEEIPFMRLNDIKSEENLDNCTQSQMIQNQEDSFNMVFHEENSIAREKRKKLAAIERRYYQSEMKKLELQRQRHDVNMRHFSSQVLKEKESILYCESAIKLLQMTIAMVEETMI